MAASSRELDILVDLKVRRIVKQSIGNDWKDLARELDIDDHTIDALEIRYTKEGTQEICYQALKTWMERKSSRASVSVLVDSLIAIDRCDLGDKVLDYIQSINPPEAVGQLSHALTSIKLEDEGKPIQKEKSPADYDTAVKIKRADIFQRFIAEKVLIDSYCELCKKSFSGYDPVMAHLNSKGHADIIKKISPDVPNDWPPPVTACRDVTTDKTNMAKEAFRSMKCPVCNTDLNGYVQVLAHLRGDKHSRRINKKP